MSLLGVGGFCVKARTSWTGGVVRSGDAIEGIASGLIEGRWLLAMIGVFCRLEDGLGDRRGWWLMMIIEKGV